jgi:hypothetical protein
MIEQPYLYYELGTETKYFFESIGENISVYKIVGFTLLPNGNWNLGFGDLQKDGSVDDSVVTNNHDVRKVIGTVAKIAMDFLRKYPERIIEIKPVDRKRKTLYNLVFNRYFEEINAFLDIWGFIEQEKEPYIPTKTYNKFTIKLKS